MEKELYRRPVAGDHPPNLSPDYRSTPGRAPRQKAIVLPHTLSEITGPLLESERLDALENDLTKQRSGEPLGERIVVHGRVLDQDGRAVPKAMVEIWQCNAGGPVPPSGRSARRAARSQFLRRRAGIVPTRRAGTSSSPSSPAPIRGRTITTPGGRRTSTSRCSGRPSPRA
jgi:protocatechuate 3,4-dioxygenase beta subunit